MMTRLLLMLCASGGALSVWAGDTAAARVPQPPSIVRPAADTPEALEPTAPPDFAPSLTRLLSAPYLTPDEKRDIRLFHGIWTEEDLDSPAQAAQAALARGDYLDPSFDFDGVDPYVKVQALTGRGDYSAAAEALEKLPKADVPPIIEFRLRAEIQESRGEFDAAARTCDNGLRALSQRTPATLADVVEAVQLLDQRIRLKGTDAGKPEPGAAAQALKADPNAFHQMLETLGQLRERADASGPGGSGAKLYWPALLGEARLLYERDKAQDAQAAIEQLLALNPGCIEGWALLGSMAVDSFNFEQAEKIALRLDLIAANPAPNAPLAEGEEAPKPLVGMSIDAAIIRARVAMRQIDGARAVEVLDPLLAKYPNHPMLLAMRSAAEATRFEFEALKQRLADYDKRFPNSPTALFWAGKALAESRQYEQSAELLLEAHNRSPAEPEIPAELGLMYVQFGLIEEAKTYLERAFDLDPFNLRVDNTLRLVRELLTYSEVESDHFVVRYKPTSPGDAAFAKDIIAGMEANYKIVTGNGPGGIDHEPFGGKGKAVIDLMPDHEWFGVRIAGMPAIHTIAASTGPAIAMEAPREGPKHQGNYDWLRVLRHEYTHTVNLDRTHNRIPHWFTEASAVYLELSPRDYSTCELLRNVVEADELFDFSEINIAFVRPKKASDRSQGYAQGHWMYEYMIERWGKKAPLDLMDLYAQGVREEQGFQSVLGLSRAEFLAQFKVWAVEQLRQWGMLAPAGMPSIKELVEQLRATTETKETESPKPTGDEARPKADANDDDDSDIDAPKLTPEVVNGWLEKYPTHPDVLELAVAQGVKKAGGKATPELVPLIERYAAARPVDPKPHRLLAQMYLGLADPAERAKAIPHLEFLDAREQKATAYATELAKLYFARDQEGDLARAQAKAERATQIAPYAAPPRELAAAVAIKMKDFPAAQRHIEALIELEPDRDIHKQRLEALKKLAKS